MSRRWWRLGRVVPAIVVLVAVTTGASDCDPPSTGAAVYHWPQAVVYVQDATGPAWPVKAAVQQWDAVLTLSVRYGKCRDGAGCIKVRAVDQLPNDYMGQTQMRHDLSGQMTGATSNLSDQYAGEAPAVRLMVACHELGHALGLERHNEDADSCMSADRDADKTSTRPGKQDLAELNAAGGAR